jgi:hypothetical protein
MGLTDQIVVPGHPRSLACVQRGGKGVRVPDGFEPEGFKVGKLPKRSDYRTLTLPTYTKELPDPPSSVDHQRDVTVPWGMLGNDNVVLPLMTAAKMDQLEPQMHKVCKELIAGFKDSGRCDMVADFARRYPIAIFGDLFGLPPE